MHFEDDGHLFSDQYCRVQKHRFDGCAIVTFASRSLRSEVLESCTSEEQPDPLIRIGDVLATVTGHIDKRTREQIPTAIFVGWGSNIEKRPPVTVASIAHAFSDLIEYILVKSLPSSFSPLPDELPPCRFEAPSLVAAVETYQ
eukprot:TRINITY_DN1709_c0_g1_i2.p1 TRINITY_DN1709_c0_g1~~TRINITY_DN1709_c0_g1_i2.p1  ORF type:complete len:143 (+),score=14.15 TRINITY_DN1709_c0_g1_i2:52-480(+)